MRETIALDYNKKTGYTTIIDPETEKIEKVKGFYAYGESVQLSENEMGNKEPERRSYWDRLRYDL